MSSSPPSPSSLSSSLALAERREPPQPSEDAWKYAREIIANPREGRYLTYEDLAHTNLTGAYLKGAYLKGANLTGANLTGANLTRATGDIMRTNLMDAILINAKLIGANLTGADLRGAYLTDADLTDATLTDADLTGADLTGAIGIKPVAEEPSENEVNPDEREHDKALVAGNDTCNWEAGPYDIKKEDWMMIDNDKPSVDRFVVQLPDIVQHGTDKIISHRPTENYLCLSLFELRRLNKVETQSPRGTCEKYEFEEFYECRKVLMDKVRRSHRTPLGFGVTDYIKDPAYVKIGSYFVKKPTWFWYGDSHRHVPEPRKFKLVFTGKKYLVQKTISVCEQGVVSGVHCDLKDLYSTYELVPIISDPRSPISGPRSPFGRSGIPLIPLPAIRSLRPRRPGASGGTLIRNKRKSTRRKSTRRKSTRRKSTRRKSTRRKSNRR